MNRKTIPALDGVRGIAALIVVVYHLHLKHLRWMPDGGFGVLIFFVLSGFLITWLLLKEADTTGDISFRGFYKRRSLRIFPAFYACWILYAVTLALSGHSLMRGSVFSSLLYVNDYYFPFHDNDSFMGFSWSLGVEEQFYLLWPLLFWIFRKRLNSLSAGVVGVILLTWINRAVLKFIVHVAEHYLSYAFDCHVDHLMMGALAAITLRTGQLSRFWTLACRPICASITVAVLAVSISFQLHFGHAYDHTIGFMIDPLLIAILLPQLVSLEMIAPFSWLNSPIARFMGRISYPLYLYHLFALEYFGPLFAKDNPAVEALAVLMASIVLATASYYIVERPFLAMKKRADQGQRRTSAPALAT